MDLDLHDAATLLGCSERTLRARLSRGLVKGTKTNNRWVIRRDDLPLTAEQRRSLQGRADEVRATVERTLARHQPSHSVEDLEPFREGRNLLLSLPASDPAAADLHAGLLALAEGHHEYAAGRKAEAMRTARAHISRAAARFLLDPMGERQGSGRFIEQEILPRLGGLIRWAEGLPA